MQKPRINAGALNPKEFGNFLDDVMRLIDKTQRCVLNKDTRGATTYLATLKKSLEAEINVAKGENNT